MSRAPSNPPQRHPPGVFTTSMGPTWDNLTERVAGELLGNAPEFSTGVGAFCYRLARADDSPEAAAWFLQFYRVTTFTILGMRKSLIELG